MSLYLQSHSLLIDTFAREITQSLFGIGERASRANESPSFDIQGLAVSTGEIPIHFVECCPKCLSLVH